MIGYPLKMVNSILAILIGLATVSQLQSIVVDGKSQLPAGLQPCKKTDPNVSGCIKKLLDSIISKADVGIPEIGLSPFDPLNIPEMVIIPSNKNGKNHVIFRNSKISGLKRLQIRSLQADLPHSNIKVEAFIPHIDIQGTYDIDYQIMNFRAKGKGSTTGSIDDINGKSDFKDEIKTINGVKYLQMSNATVDVKIKKYGVKFEKLFADSGTNDEFNALVNNPAMKESPIVKNVIASIGSNILKETMNSILKHIPYDDFIQ